MSIAGNISFLFNGHEMATALQSFRVNLGLDELDATVLANTYRSYEAGFTNGQIDTSGVWSSDTVNADEIHEIYSSSIVAQGTNTIAASLGSTAAGDFAFIANACQLNYDIPEDTGALIFANANFRTKTGLDFGVWLMDAAIAEGTTNGTTVDNLAATSNGGLFVVHLHNDDATDVDVKLQDSANGSVWADVSGVAVNNLSATHTSGYATAAKGTTIRQYIRAVAVVTGGDTIQVSAAFARR